MWKSGLKYNQVNQEPRSYEVSNNALFLHLKKQLYSTRWK